MIRTSYLVQSAYKGVVEKYDCCKTFFRKLCTRIVLKSFVLQILKNTKPKMFYLNTKSEKCVYKNEVKKQVFE